MNSFMEGLVTIVLAIIGLGLVAALVSRRSNTAGVVQAFSSGLGNTMGVALSPVTGQSYGINLHYPSQGFGYGGSGFDLGFGS